ncbi:hypothetical protein [Maridesulfovibrio zosterae]|uniref:hypothetical protein n=1 Tax=Maridesulfovibrio zosterae TaxID=82171 RepID=UPI0012EC6ACD|nr:hypothetical protein [Maridesulfovibrio zosterae]
MENELKKNYDIDDTEDSGTPDTIYEPDVDKNLERNAAKKHMMVSQQYCGPLPTPKMLKEYGDVVKGLPEALTTSFIKESEHRREMELKEHELEKIYVHASINDSHRGSWFGFLLCAGAIAGGVYAAVSGAQIAGGLIGCSGMAGLVIAFKSGINISPNSNSPETEKTSDQSQQEVDS